MSQYIWYRKASLFVAALMCVAFPSGADEVGALSLADEIAGKTYRIDERTLRSRVPVWSEPQFVYFDHSGHAHIWHAGKPRVQRASWRVHVRTMDMRLITSTRYAVQREECIVGAPVSALGQLRCEKEAFEWQAGDFPGAGNQERRYSFIRLCIGTVAVDSFRPRGQCRSEEDFRKMAEEVMEGDVLDLRSGRVPGRLCQDSATFADVVKRATRF